VKASPFEFRFRQVISAAIYVLGFWAPWLRFGPSAEATPTRLWSWLAIELARFGVLRVQAAYLLVTILVVVLATVGAGLRMWGTAYLGRSVVSGNAMQADGVVAAGPYRYVRNPLYLGSMLTALAVSILMPASGAVFFVVLLSIFVIRLALGEEFFLKAKIGDAYVEYCRSVPRWFPSISSRLPVSTGRAEWLSAMMAEVFPLGMALCFAVFAWSYDAQLLIRCLLICFGLSLIARAVPRRQPANG
jgi:protein-S-isoprenylcysteine O-methyltransferase Ste14